MITFDDERGVGTVSITDYAQKSLGDVVFVELPEKGTTIEQGGELSFATLPTTTNVDPPSQFNQKSNHANIQNPLAPWRALKQPRTSCVPVPKKSTHGWLL